MADEWLDSRASRRKNIIKALEDPLSSSILHAFLHHRSPQMSRYDTELLDGEAEVTFPGPTNKPARCELMRCGACLADGSMSESIRKVAVCKCYNCAEFISLRAGKEPTHGPMPGESSDCLRCGWFVHTTCWIW